LISLTVVIPTHNEEGNLPACLETIRELGCNVFIVDSGSVDRTFEIAQAYGARIAIHAFETHAKQWHWALQNLPIASEWVLGLDADQRLSPEAVREILRRLSDKDGIAEINGFYIKRRQVFRGRWIKRGGYYPKYLLKLFRRDKVKIDLDDLLDHHFYVAGKTAKLCHDLIEANRKEDDICFWIDKHNRYATLLASEEYRRYSKSGAQLVNPSVFGTPDQRTLWLKQIWHRLPLYVRPFIYFFYRYVVRLGFLDGRQGFVFHFLQGFWFRLLVDIKLDELRREPRTGQRSEVG
jgi:glycosyltransferase involved in cell wall biosynthesis